MKYIDSEKLIAEIERLSSSEHPIEYEPIEKLAYNRALLEIEGAITSLQQEQPEDKLKNIAYWLEHFDMPKENIENCITQISQGYGAIRYLEGVQHGAEAVNELAQQEQPSLPSNLDEAAKRIAYDVCKQLPNGEEKDGIVYYAILAVIAGAKWMAGQISKAE